MFSNSHLSAMLFLLENQNQDVWESNKPLSIDELVSHNNEVSSFFPRGDRLMASITYLNENLRNGADAESYQTILYDCGKLFYGKENLRGFFADMYFKITERTNSGSRMGLVVDILGVDEFLRQLNSDIYILGGYNE